MDEADALRQAALADALRRMMAPQNPALTPPPMSPDVYPFQSQGPYRDPNVVLPRLQLPPGYRDPLTPPKPPVMIPRGMTGVRG